MKRENRTRIYRVDENLMLMMLNGIADCQYLLWPVSIRLPDDAVIERVWHNHAARCLDVMVWSATFDIVPLGEQPPDGFDSGIPSEVFRFKRIEDTHEIVDWSGKDCKPADQIADSVKSAKENIGYDPPKLSCPIGREPCNLNKPNCNLSPGLFIVSYNGLEVSMCGDCVKLTGARIKAQSR